MRILMISKDVWNSTNSFGNSYSNIFDGVPDIEIATIVLGDGQPDYIPYVKRTYQIEESGVIRTFFKCRNKENSVGREIYVPETPMDISVESTENHPPKKYTKLLSFGKKHHFRVLFWGRELAWLFGHINYDGMLEFIRDYNPDIFFLPYDNIFYTNRIGLFIKKHIDIPMVMDFGMDHYTLQRFSFDPIFWIDRFLKRRIIRKLVGMSSYIYVISDKLKSVYEKALHVECKVLYKIIDDLRCSSQYDRSEENPQFLYTGNIYANRWKSLSLLAQELKKKRFGHLDVYTSSPITKKISRALNIPGVSQLHESVSQARVIELQNDADVLVHVESFDIFNKSLVRCALSTKIMDYLSVGRCVLAIGPSDIASMEYLSNNDIAVVAFSKNDVAEQIAKMKRDPSIIMDYSHRGMDFIHAHLDPMSQHMKIYDDLQSAVCNYNNKNNL